MKKLLAILLVFVIALLTACSSNENNKKVFNWEYDENTHTLTISGTGAMSDYSCFDGITTAPWQSDYEKIKTLIIKNAYNKKRRDFDW